MGGEPTGSHPVWTSYSHANDKVYRELAARLAGDLTHGLSRVFLAVVLIALAGVLAGLIFPNSRPRPQPEPTESAAPAK
jgi:hypothetical protein